MLSLTKHAQQGEREGTQSQIIRVIGSKKIPSDLDKLVNINSCHWVLCVIVLFGVSYT